MRLGPSMQHLVATSPSVATYKIIGLLTYSVWFKIRLLQILNVYH